MIYLASPYSHADPLIMKTRFLIAEQVTARMLARKEHVYSPIVHCHEIAQKFELPTDFDFWQSYNFDFLRRSDRFFVLQIEGWKQSKGVTTELAFAQAAGIEVSYIQRGSFYWPE